MQKQYRLYFLAALTGLALGIYHAGQAPSAFAGGFDYPDMASPESLMPDNTQKTVERSLSFDWKRWSQPYSQGNQMCREYQGNVVCFTPQIAKKMGWSLR